MLWAGGGAGELSWGWLKGEVGQLLKGKTKGYSLRKGVDTGQAGPAGAA